MSQCLKESLLLLLHEGEGTSAQQGHLAECESCATRYRQLGRDLEAIGQVLRGEPPPEAVRHRPHALTVRWLPTAAVLLIVLMVVWGSVRMWNSSPSPHLEKTSSEEIWEFLEEASTALFFPEDAIAEEEWLEVGDLHDLPVVLGEEWPCEWEDALAWSEGGIFDEAVGEFGVDAFSLLCGRQQVS